MDGPLAIIDIDAVTSLWLNWLSRALVMGTVLAGFTWLITPVLRSRKNTTLEGVLWTVVLIKFLVPAGPLSVWSLTLPPPTETARPPLDDSGVPVTARTNVPFEAETTHHAPAPARVTPPTATYDLATSAAPAAKHWSLLAPAAYMLCTLGLFSHRIRSHRVMLRRSYKLPHSDACVHALVVGVCRRLGVRRVPSIRISDEAPAPYVIGLLHPLLVLSHRQLVRPDELETVIVHEVAHLRRGDLFVRLLQWIAGTLLFFWPVVAWVNRRIDVVREYACDEWALRYGKLTATDYARCLLGAVQPTRGMRPVFQLAGMAANHKTIERRIDMILNAHDRAPMQRSRRRLAAAFLLPWAGIALTGAVSATASRAASDWPVTEDAVKEHAIVLYSLVAQRAAADVNGDNIVSYLEKSAYLVSLAMQDAAAFMEAFPYADRDHSGRLDMLEAYDTIRGVTLIAYADRRDDPLAGARLDLEFYHDALDAQQWLLDNVMVEPDPGDVENALAVVRRMSSPRSDHVRKLDHGAPVGTDAFTKASSHDRPRFAELEANIATVKAKLANSTRPAETAKFQTMLDKLETILDKLQGS